MDSRPLSKRGREVFTLRWGDHGGGMRQGQASEIFEISVSGESRLFPGLLTAMAQLSDGLLLLRSIA